MEDLRHIKELISSHSAKDEQLPGQEKHQGEGEKRSSRGDHQDANDPPTDSVAALKLFLDRIPISSVPRIDAHYPPDVEINSNDCVADAIALLREKAACGAPVVDSNSKPDFGGFREKQMGFIHLYKLLLWCLEEIDRYSTELGGYDIRDCDFFSALERVPHLRETKVIQLAQSIWEPFFPVNPDDTLLHILLLFAKHHTLEVVPVVEPSRIIGYINQNAVMQLLLQSSGLEWFDRVADMALSVLRFQTTISIDGDRSLADALHILWLNRVPTIAIVDKNDRKLIGRLGCKDACKLLEEDLFNMRRKLTVKEFVKLYGSQYQSRTGATGSRNHCEFEVMDFGSVGLFANKESDQLKEAMQNMVTSDCYCSFLINEAKEVVGTVTARDVIMQFAPPTLEPKAGGINFVESALYQTGCVMEGGEMICN